jgi:hypothetical protein
VAALILSFGITLKLQGWLVSAFEFDHDVNAEQCKKDIVADLGVCISNSTMWFSCPTSCSRAFNGGRGTMAEERNDPERFYELHSKRMSSSADMDYNKENDFSLEDNEGYITLYAVLPLHPGMAEYYYDAIEHIAQVYKYTLVAMILPYYDTTNEKDGSEVTSSTSILQAIVGSRIAGEAKSKSILLAGYDVQTKTDNEILEYLLTREVVAGTLALKNHDNDDYDDNVLLISRPNLFLVSHTGMFIERIVSPTMEVIEKRIKVHELAMEDRLEL